MDKMDKILLVFSKSHMIMVHISQHNLYLILSWKRVCHHCTGVCPAQLLEFSGLRWTHCCLAGMKFRGWHQLSLSLSPGIPKWSYRSTGVCWLGEDIHWIFESIFMYQSHLSEVFHARNNDKVPGNLHIYPLKKQQKIGVDEYFKYFLFQRWDIPQFLGRSILSFCHSVIARTWKVSCLIISPWGEKRQVELGCREEIRDIDSFKWCDVTKDFFRNMAPNDPEAWESFTDLWKRGKTVNFQKRRIFHSGLARILIDPKKVGKNQEFSEIPLSQRVWKGWRCFQLQIYDATLMVIFDFELTHIDLRGFTPFRKHRKHVAN